MTSAGSDAPGCVRTADNPTNHTVEGIYVCCPREFTKLFIQGESCTQIQHVQFLYCSLQHANHGMSQGF